MPEADRPVAAMNHGVARGSRIDARRNLERLLVASKAVFAEDGIDAPIRRIADRAGVGVGTLYRHFPTRGDLAAAVFHHEIEACADTASTLAACHEPFDALMAWTLEFTALAVAKRGLIAGTLAGDPAFRDVPARREQLLRPAFRQLFRAAVEARQSRDDVDPDEFMDAVASLCMGAFDRRLAYAQRMVALLVEGLRHGTEPPKS